MDWCPGAFHKRSVVGSIPTPATNLAHVFISPIILGITEQEPRRISETQPASLYNALLVHGYYWMSEPTPGHVKLALRSHLAVRAASFVCDHGFDAGKIVVDLGHLGDPIIQPRENLWQKNSK